MKVKHERCAGLDVHKKEVVACLRLVTRGKAGHEVRRFATTTRGLIEMADWLEVAECRCVAMEATGVYWKPVWHILDGRFELILANAAHIKGVPGRKSDVNDAMWIADLSAHDMICPSFVPPQPIQELRDLTRTRKQLTREIVQHTQRIQAVLEEANIKLSSAITDILGASGRRILKAMIAGEADPDKLSALGSPRLATPKAALSDALYGRVREHHRFLIDQHMKTIEQLEATITAFDARIVENRTQVLAAISHDLRTELQLLRLRAENMEPVGDREKMLTTIAGMEAMVAATLNFSRDESAVEPRRRTDLAALVASAVDDMSDAGMPVKFASPAEAIVIECQPTALRRALTNLIDNAVKYGQRARVSLISGPDVIEIAIDDDGPGIPEAEQGKVLQPFYRLETSRSRETGGMGLGLGACPSNRARSKIEEWFSHRPCHCRLSLVLRCTTGAI